MNFLKRIVIDDKGCWLFQGYLMRNKTGMGYGWVYFQAMILLDKVKDGVPFPLHLINKALELTGDLE